MQINKKILEVKQKLPSGSMKVISMKTGISQKTVGSFFKGNTKYRLETYKKIMNAADEIIVELNSI
jgi:hypothetical protein